MKTKLLYLCAFVLFFSFINNGYGQCGNFSGLDPDYCTTSPPETLTPVTPGGTFSGNGIAGNVFTPSIAGPGLHTITYTIAVPGCTTSTSQTTTVTTTPVMNAGPDSTICSGNGMTMQATGIANSYHWSPIAGLSNPNILNPVATPTITTTYSLTGTNNGGGAGQIIYSENFDMNVTPTGAATAWCDFRDLLLVGYNYQSLTVSGSNNPTGVTLSDPATVAAIALALRTETNYTATIGGNTWNVSTGCVSGSSPCLGSPGVVLHINTSSCNCDPADPNIYVLRPEINNSNWGGINTQTCNAPTQTMDVVFTIGSVCQATDQVTITVIPGNNANFTGLNAIYCLTAGNDTLVPITPGGTFTGDGIINGNIYSPSTAGLGPDTVIYTVTIGNCTNTSTQITNIVTAPTVNAGPDSTICEGDSLTMQATAGGAVNYAWSPTAGLSNPYILNPIAFPTVTTIYTLTVSPGGVGGGRVYLRSTTGQPWGANVNEDAMTVVFGVGNWQDLRYETAPAATVFNGSNRFVFMEGSDQNATELEAYLIANLPLIEAWVNSGGSLLLNSAPNEDNGMNFGFSGTVLDYSNACGNVTAVNNAHPIFIGPNVPVGTAFAGNSFSHSHVTGTGLTNVIQGCGVFCLSEKQWGTGRVMFGGMTTTNYHTPLPHAQNLRINIISYLDGLAGTGGCTATDEVTITVNPTPSGDFAGLNGAYCENAVPDTLFPVDPGGVFTGPGMTGNLFNPALAGPGTHSITYTHTLGNCTGTGTQTTMVVASPTIDAGNDTTICAGQSVTINATASGAISYLWSPTAGLNNPNILNPIATPTATTTYTLTASSGGVGTGKVYMRSNTGAPWGQTTNENAMTAVFGAGNWQDLRYETAPAATVFVTTNRFVFMEGSDGNASELEAYLNTNLPVIESWVNSGGSLLLNSAPNEDDGMNFGFTGTILHYNNACSNVNAVNIAHPIFVGPNLPVGTNFTGSSFSHSHITGIGLTNVIQGCGVFCLTQKQWGMGNVMFGGMTTTNFHTPSPHADNLRKNIFVYLDGLAVTGACTATDQVTITLGAGNAGFTGLIPPYCTNDTLVQLNPVTPGGTFSGPGVSGNIFNPSVAGVGTHTITYTLLPPCAGTSSQIVNVGLSPDATFTGLGTVYCLSDSAETMVPATPGGTFSGPGVSGITFDPAAAGIGTHLIQYVITTGFCADSTTQTVIVDSIPVVGLTGLDATYCLDDAGSTLIGSPAGGIYAGPGVSGNFFLPASAGVGTHTITYTFTTPGGCVGLESVQTIVNALPVVGLNIPQDTVCSIDPSFGLSGESPSGGTFTGTGVTGNTFDPGVAGAGSHSVTYTFTDANGCVNSASDDIVVEICTEIQNASLEGAWSIFPNPASDFIFIKWEGNFSEKVNVMILDILGREVRNLGEVIFNPGDQNQIPVSSLKTGTYFIRINENTKVTELNFIRQ